MRPLEPEQIGHLLDVAGTDRMGALIELAVLTGLRRGELLGLRWSDVDLERSVVHVRQQVTQDVANLEPCASCGRAHRGLRFSLPKTRSSEARVDLDGRAVGTLMAHRLQQDVERTAWGAEYADHGLVFAREDGDPYDPAVVTRTFQAAGQGGRSAGRRVVPRGDPARSRVDAARCRRRHRDRVETAAALVHLDHVGHVLAPA